MNKTTNELLNEISEKLQTEIDSDDTTVEECIELSKIKDEIDSVIMEENQ